MTTLTPRVHVFHSRANAAFIAGMCDGTHVIAKMTIPEIDGTEEESFEIIYRAKDAKAADNKLLEIVGVPGPLRVV